MINCDAPSQIKEGIGNGPSVLVVLNEELIQQPPGHMNQSYNASPESERTTQIRVEIELICKVVSASE